METFYAFRWTNLRLLLVRFSAMMLSFKLKLELVVVVVVVVVYMK